MQSGFYLKSSDSFRVLYMQVVSNSCN